MKNKRSIKDLEAELKKVIGEAKVAATLENSPSPAPYNGDTFIRLAKRAGKILKKNDERNSLPPSTQHYLTP